MYPIAPYRPAYYPPPPPYAAPPPPPPAAAGWPPAPTVAPQYGTPGDGWRGMINGLIMTIATPIGTLAGLGIGALAARLAGRVVVNGGMWGAILGSLAAILYVAAKGMSPGIPVLFTSCVVASSGLGFLIGGPVGAIVGAILATPLAVGVGNLMMLRWRGIFD